jgi:acylphosphatase
MFFIPVLLFFILKPQDYTDLHESSSEGREMKRANIIAKGKVQKVGYRDFAQDSARELGITGYVENLEDGTVKIVCEGEETKIEEFIRDIKVKKDFIDVSETSVKYEEPTGEFKLFKIKYGDVPEELGDRLGAALLYLNATNQKIDAGFGMLGEK